MLSSAHAQPSTDPALTEAVRGFEAALSARDLERTLAAWHFASPEERTMEEALLRGVLSASQVSLSSNVSSGGADGQTAVTLGTLVQISGPRGSVDQWSLLWRKTPAGWRIASRQTFGGVGGVVHLDLEAQGFVARGQTIELEDFTLKMISGTFFLNTQEAGPTALVFVGKGRVTFRPRPATERGQMKIFAKSEVLQDQVSRAFLRLHPADLYRTLKPGSFVDDPKSSSRLSKATEFFERHKRDAFVLDAPIAGAPWWLLPGVGDATVAFETKHFGTLTFALSSNEVEGVSLFNRSSRRQISVYPRAASVESSGEERRPFDLIHHDLSLSLNPVTFDLTGRDTMTIDIVSPMSSIKFRLDEDLALRSIRSAEGGGHLFFRVRGQNSVLVSLGSLSGRVGRLNLTMEYGGRLAAGTVESEILQIGQILQGEESPSFRVDPALIYSKRRAFYPEIGEEDYATSTLHVTVPADWTVVSGGTRSETSNETSRTIIHEQTRASKYIAFVVARLKPIASERQDDLSFEAYAQSRMKRDALRSLDALKSATRFFSDLFGPLPYTPLNLAWIEAPTPGGHSPPGLLVLQLRPALMGRSLSDDPATFYDIPGFFLAHELAHQWWGHGVTPKSYRDRWVSEGFAQYSAALWTRESQGEETFSRALRKMATWAKRMSSFGPVNLGTRVGHIQNNGQAHRAVVYDKGALVLDMVRRLLGDEAFARGLLKLQRDNRFGPVTTEMVRHAFEAEGAIDLDGLFETFVRNTTVPTMKVIRHADVHEIVVAGYNGPLPVTVRLGDKRLDLVVTGRLVIPGAGPGAKIILDPDGVGLVKIEG